MPVELLAAAEDLRIWFDLEPDDVASIPTERATLLLEGVSKAVLTECRRSTFAVVEETVRIDGNGGLELLVPHAPVVDVSDVVEDPDGLYETITLVPPGVGYVERVEWSADGILRRVDGERWLRRFRFYAVTLQHGYPETPEDVRNLVCRVAARAVSNPEGLATETAGAYNAGFAFDETRLPTLTRPDRRDLDEYRL